MDRIQILAKIKLLQSLSTSSNINEADNAKAMINKLIIKYDLTEDDLKSLEEKKPLYGDDDKLFVTIGLVSWKQQLALAIGKHFFCKIVQEELVPIEGIHQFTYFVYGHPEDAETTKFVYNTFANKVENLIKIKCLGKGPVYISSYCEGVVESIKNNIKWDGIQIPNIKKPSSIKDDNVLNNGSSNLSKSSKEEKEKPTEASVYVNNQNLIKDINAYFRGLDHGKDITIDDDVLELKVNNEIIKELKTNQEEIPNCWTQRVIDEEPSE